MVYFSIIQDFASTDVDALIMERKKQVGVRFFECDLVSKSSHLSNLLKANGVCWNSRGIKLNMVDPWR